MIFAKDNLVMSSLRHGPAALEDEMLLLSPARVELVACDRGGSYWSAAVAAVIEIVLVEVWPNT